ncbi:MAG: alpha/beta fold hydrolase [Acidobacteria bacterium]|nr:MAG: alpha/beta fold hydrolase [Acidobacteriota bacterium]
MRRAAVEVGHKKISYLVREPAAPATRQHPVRNVVFLHAFPLQAAMWESTLGAIPDGWRAIAPDYRGFGQTPLPDSDRSTLSDFAGDVIDLLDRLEIVQAAVIGCSMGGYVLFEILKSAPRYVSAAGLVSTRPGADSEEGRRGREKMIDLVIREGAEAVASQMVPKLLGATTQNDRPDLTKHVRNLIVENPREGIKTAVKAMMERADSTSLLGKIDVPALIVHGTEDTLIPPSEAEGMHKAMRNAQLELMPFSGHLPNLEQSAPFDGILWQFLNKL